MNALNMKGFTKVKTLPLSIFLSSKVLLQTRSCCFLKSLAQLNPTKHQQLSVLQNFLSFYIVVCTCKWKIHINSKTLRVCTHVCEQYQICECDFFTLLFTNFHFLTVSQDIPQSVYSLQIGRVLEVLEGGVLTYCNCLAVSQDICFFSLITSDWRSLRSGRSLKPDITNSWISHFTTIMANTHHFWKKIKEGTSGEYASLHV